MNGYSASSRPCIEIVEQPAPKALRFRYECEGRSAGSIPGERSTADNRSYPTVRVVGYEGDEDIVIVVSCVTKNQPYLAHPHNLVGKDCKEGVCSINLDKGTKTAVFSNLGIQCVKKRDIEAALKLRETKHLDPYKSGFDHKNNPSSIDLNCVRLCFQAIIKTTKPALLGRVVSNPVYDKKAMSDLLITKLSHTSGSARGGTEVVLLCEKINKDDIQVRFYEDKEGQEVWVGFAKKLSVHKQVAIAFETPPYQNQEIPDKVLVYVQLFRPSDKATSEPREFYYIGSGYPLGLKRQHEAHNPYKRPRNVKDFPSNELVAGIYDIKPSTSPFPVKIEPNSSPSSPYQNQNTYSPSVTPVPNEQTQAAYVSIPSTSGFDLTWQQPTTSSSSSYQNQNAFLIAVTPGQCDQAQTLIPVAGPSSSPSTLGATWPQQTSSPSSPYHNPNPYLTSVNPVQTEQTLVAGTTMSSTATFGEPWQQSINYTNIATYTGGTIIALKQQQFLDDFLELDLHSMSSYTNASPGAPEPLTPYGNNEENPSNVEMTSVERIVEKSDLLGISVANANNVDSSTRNDDERLCDSFSNNMNISNISNSFDRLVQEKIRNLEPHH